VFQNNKIPILITRQQENKNESDNIIKINDKVRLIVERKTFAKKSFERI
jgi:hypothetical protein